MKISTRAQYGTRLMVELGLHYGKGPALLKDIAEAEDISQKYLSQIIIPLKSAGLVISFRGAHGGYMLAREPSEITLREIVEVLEGGFELVRCIRDPSGCSRVSVCVTRSLWQTLGERIAQTLEALTLEDLVKQCRKRKITNLMYNI